MSRWKIIEVKANEYKVITQCEYIVKAHNKEQAEEDILEGEQLTENVIEIIRQRSGVHIDYQVTDTEVLDAIEVGTAEEEATICYHTYDKQEALKWLKKENKDDK